MYLFDLFRCWREANSEDTVVTTYTYGDDLISMKRNSGISEICGYYHYDGLGTVKQMTDSNGAVIEKYSYDAFGNSTIFSPSNEPRDTSSLGNAHGYTGERQFDEADRLVFLRARYYDSSTGRFISRDPIGYADSMSLYTYCKNNPIRWIDPFGKCPSDYAGCMERARKQRDNCMAAARDFYNGLMGIINSARERCERRCDETYGDIPGGAPICHYGCSIVAGVQEAAAFSGWLSGQLGCALGYLMDADACRDDVVSGCPCH